MATTNRPTRRPVAGLALAIAFALLVAACTSSGDDQTESPTTTERSQGGPTTTTTTPEDPSEPVPVDDGIAIVVVSSQPDRVSGPEARIRVRPGKGGDLAGSPS